MGLEDTKGAVLTDTAGLIQYEVTETGCMRGSTRALARWGPSAETVTGQESPALTQKLTLFDILLKGKKNQFSPMVSHLV